eukprot:SAG11_NODE_1533_length_4732_cov_3.368012_4_plen_186_part_00
MPSRTLSLQLLILVHTHARHKHCLLAKPSAGRRWIFRASTRLRQQWNRSLRAGLETLNLPRGRPAAAPQRCGERLRVHRALWWCTPSLTISLLIHCPASQVICSANRQQQLEAALSNTLAHVVRLGRRRAKRRSWVRERSLDTWLFSTMDFVVLALDLAIPAVLDSLVARVTDAQQLHGGAQQAS